MEKYIFDEGNGLWYELQGNYYIPCLTVPAHDERPIGIWGQRQAERLFDRHQRTGNSANALADKANGRAGGHHGRA